MRPRRRARLVTLRDGPLDQVIVAVRCSDQFLVGVMISDRSGLPLARAVYRRDGRDVFTFSHEVVEYAG